MGTMGPLGPHGVHGPMGQWGSLGPWAPVYATVLVQIPYSETDEKLPYIYILIWFDVHWSLGYFRAIDGRIVSLL